MQKQRLKISRCLNCSESRSEIVRSYTLRSKHQVGIIKHHYVILAPIGIELTAVLAIILTCAAREIITAEVSIIGKLSRITGKS